MLSNFSWFMYLVFGALVFTTIGMPWLSVEMKSGIRTAAQDSRYATTGTYSLDDQINVNKITGAQLIGLVCEVTGSNCIGTMVEGVRTLVNVPLKTQQETSFILYIDGTKIDQSTSTKSIDFRAVTTNSYTLTYGKDKSTGKVEIHANHI